MKRIPFLAAALIALSTAPAFAQDGLVTLEQALRAKGLTLQDVTFKNSVTTAVLNPVTRTDEADKEVREVWTKDKVVPPVPEKRTQGERVTFLGKPLSATVRSGSRVVKRTVEDREATSEEYAVVDDQKAQPATPQPAIAFKRYVPRAVQQ